MEDTLAMTEPDDKNDNKKRMRASPDQRIQAMIDAVYAQAAAHETRMDELITDAIREAIRSERENCARLLDGIKDEYIEWCVLNRVSTPEQMQFATLLSKAAASIRGHLSEK